MESKPKVYKDKEGWSILYYSSTDCAEIRSKCRSIALIPGLRITVQNYTVGLFTCLLFRKAMEERIEICRC